MAPVLRGAIGNGMPFLTPRLRCPILFPLPLVLCGFISGSAEERMQAGLSAGTGHMKSDPVEIGRQLAGLAWVGVRAFASTLLIFTFAGFVLAGLSYYFLHEFSVLIAGIAIAVSFAEATFAGVVLGMKRARILTMAHGIHKLGLGRSFVHLVFARLLGVAEGKEDDAIAVAAKEIPLVQAEELLSKVIREAKQEAVQSGWLRRTVQEKMLEVVRACTLARFREEGSEVTGVDLLKVKTDVERAIDNLLIDQLQRELRFWTAAVMLGLPLTVAVQTILALLILHSRG